MFEDISMHTVTVSERDEIVLPLEIRNQLGITVGTQLNLILENAGLRIEIKPRIQPTRPEDGYGLLVCKQPGERHLANFDAANVVFKESST